MRNNLILLFILTAVFVGSAFAQGRYYVWSYPFETEEAHEFEIESYSYFFTPTLSDNDHSLLQQFELEYGVTDRFQLGVYQVFRQDYPSGRFHSKSFKFEALYKLAGHNQFLVDPLLYAEYSRDWNFKNPNDAELKLILSKDLGRFNGTLNCIVEHEFGGGNDFTPEISGGLSYQVVEGFRFGVEAFASLSDETESADEDLSGTNIGPTVAVNTPWFWLATGVTFGLSKYSDALNFNGTIGIEM